MMKSPFRSRPSNVLLVVCVLVVCRVDRTAADVSSGCPSYGCLPSGTFALSSDIPGTGQQTVGIKWTTQVSSNINRVNRLGCVSSQEGVVCATHSGFVSVDQLNGDLVWRFDNMTSPSLPIMDIYGDVIATDGRRLVEIGADGKLEPQIKIYGHLYPMYSLEPTNDDLFLMSSHISGEIITYGTDGIVEASYVLSGQVERVNGSFIPVAQPVIYGIRAYILTQFVPDSPLPQSHHILGLQRLYAVDLWRRMSMRIAPVWYYNFERETCGPLGHVHLSESIPTSSVLVHNHTVYISVTDPRGRCRPAAQQWSGQDEGTLWAIRDNGTAPEVVFKVPAPVSSLSIYDVSIGQQRKQSWDRGVFGFPHGRPHKESPKKTTASPPPILWAATSHQITGYDSRNGSILHVFNVSGMLNLTCRITSKVMVAGSKDGIRERLIFAVSSTKQGKRGNMNSMPYVVAASFDMMASQQMQILWKVAGKAGMEIVGQIPNVLVVPPKGKVEKNVKFRVEGGTGGDDDDDDDVGGGDDPEVFLVATAVNGTTQYSFAIGPV